MEKETPVYELISGRIDSCTGLTRRVRIISDTTIHPHLHIPDSRHPAFTIPSGYIFDGKSLGRMSPDNNSVITFAIHDYLYQYADRRIWRRKDADSLCKAYNKTSDQTKILDMWYAQPVLWAAWKLYIGGFHSVYYHTQMERDNN